jgi:hypothetical protein
MHRSTITIIIDSSGEGKHHMSINAGAEANGDHTRLIAEGTYPVFSDAIKASIKGLQKMHKELGGD